MELPERLRNITISREDPLERFIDENPGLLEGMDAAAEGAFRRICKSVSTWRWQKARIFYRNMVEEMGRIATHGCRSVIIDGAMELCTVHWALAKHYFSAMSSLPAEEELVRRWIALIGELWGRDMDVAITLMQETPRAMSLLGRERLVAWGEQAHVGLQSGRSMYKATRAYLQESLSWEKEGTVELSFWALPLEQARRIAAYSPKSAEAFIRHGVRVFLLLGEADAVKWVDEGLSTCALEPYEENRNFRRKVTPDQTVCSNETDLVNYFSGISSRAIETRDTLVSGITLKERANTLGLICEALLGRRAKIASNQALYGVEGFTGVAATDGRTIYLPDTVPSFMLYKLMALHQTILIGSDVDAGAAGRSVEERRRLHMAIDRRLLDRLPGLRSDMEELADGRMPADYPETDAAAMPFGMPWWGDILTSLMEETDDLIARLKAKAATRTNLPDEVLDGVVSAMMADGTREEDALWKMLHDMFGQIEFQSPDAEELEEIVKTFYYKEWDARLSDYKLDWCLVRQRLSKDDANEFSEDIRRRLHGIITLIRRQFTRLKPERFKKFRAQPYGDALDIDALVEAMVDKRSGASLSENIYVRRDKRIRDVAVLFLVDLSASTEEVVNGRRVIDIQKEAMVLMAEALDALEDPFAIYGFSSEGRFRVDMFSVKEFSETYDDTVRYRLGNLEPLGLTRMGAVLRHASYKLNKVPAAIKLMIILTDGRPYDMEYGDLDYAIADTKKAIQEARRQQLNPFIITSDKKGEEYLRRISLQTGSLILQNVENLPRLLPAIYKRLTM